MKEYALSNEIILVFFLNMCAELWIQHGYIRGLAIGLYPLWDAQFAYRNVTIARSIGFIAGCLCSMYMDTDGLWLVLIRHELICAILYWDVVQMWAKFGMHRSGAALEAEIAANIFATHMMAALITADNGGMIAGLFCVFCILYIKNNAFRGDYCTMGNEFIIYVSI